MVASALASLSVAVLAVAAPGTVLKRDILGDGIYLFRAPSDLDVWTSTNVVVIVNERDVTVFDCNTRPHVNRMVIAEIRNSPTSRCGL